VTAKKSAAEPESPKVRVRRAKAADIPGIYACQDAAYAAFSASALCDERQLALQQSMFPEGQLVAVLGKQIVGYAASLIVTLDEESPWFSYSEITGNGTFSSHDPTGDTLYGADIGVHPAHQGKGIAGQLYDARKRILTRFNLRRLAAGGRIPGYHEHAGSMTAEQYVAKVVAGELKDSALNAHLKAGYSVRGVHTGYVRDQQSLDYATFIELENPSYRAARRRIAAAPLSQPVRRVRICAAQYRMRRIDSWDQFAEQVEFFVSAAEQYDCHLLLLPELFTAQLFATLPRDATDMESIGWLADQTPLYKELFRAEAKRSGIMIAAGSHPVRSPTGIRNVAHLFTPAGNVYTQEKLHITPSERNAYHIVPGEGLRVFDTAFGRIAIVICYDIEFPELSRLLALAGVDIILVPFSTDERKGYLRVRYCAQARAVENMVYVALAGNVGNLPQVDNFLLNYAQAAVLTPSDFPFPTDGVAATAEPQAETVVITDLDMGALEQVREAGTVGLIRDRRTDLYSLEPNVAVEIVRVT
jgi:predicted amidohydrolase/ribosomal protein S18 acetylase RimI-like enzyme